MFASRFAIAANVSSVAAPRRKEFFADFSAAL
jgi:hypothetical protein